MLLSDIIAGHKDNGPFDSILQLANISRPWIVNHSISMAWGEKSFIFFLFFSAKTLRK